MNDNILSQLNPRQREAAESIDGPLLIVAGPGSGKTRLITYRIAYLLRVAGVSPGRVAAVTFTNKAAREMKARVREVVSYGAERLTLGTFHAFCAQVLRRDGEAIGLDRAFAIYDDADQIDMIKRAMNETDADPKRFAPRAVQSAISGAKSQLFTAQGFAMRTASYFDEVVGRVYERYEALMNQSAAADFDDLLLKTYLLLSEREEVARKYRERYVHFMIDEFQDTNVAQYAIARLIAGEHRNLCAVGDPDQSIYSWRNADIRNILSFQTDFPDAKIIALEQNYRSTQTILDASSKLISANTQRVEKSLFTRNGKGAPIAMAEGYDEEEEAQLVLREVNALTRGSGGARKYALGEIAVMYRVNAQSRALEEACLRYGVPYQLIGGVKFYQRQEVKDLAAYLRLIANPNDDVSLVRVINRPSRGIGRRTLDELTRAARNAGTSMFDAMGGGEKSEAEPASALGGAASASGGLSAASGAFTPRAARALGDFRDMILRLRGETQSSNIIELMDKTLDATGYRRYLSDQDDGEDRLDNINEFRTAARDFLEMDAPAALTAFLESVSLVSDVDNLEEKPDSLTLITLHQAKGLEYPVVFMVGMEDGLLPHSRSLDDPAGLEEERRLCYVGMTRAKERLYLMRAFRRGFRGGSGPNLPSRFLLDIPRELVADDKMDEPESAAPQPPARTARTRTGSTPSTRRVSGGASGAGESRPAADRRRGGGFDFGRGSTPDRRPSTPQTPDAPRAPRRLAPSARPPSSSPPPPSRSTRRSGMVASPSPRRRGQPQQSPRRRRAAAQAPPQPAFATGDKVRHAAFGDGIVTHCEPAGSDFQVTVAFKDGNGVKRLLQSFAKLEKVE